MKKWLLLSVILCFVINTANSITQQKISPTLVTNPNKVFPENRNSEWSDRTPVNDYKQDLLTYGRDTLLVSYTDGDPNGPWYLIKPDGSTEDIPNASGVASNIKANGEILSYSGYFNTVRFYNPETKEWSEGEDVPNEIDYTFTIDGETYTYRSLVREVFPLNENEVILVSFRNIVAYNINPQDTAYQTTRNIHTLPNEDIIEQGTINASAYCDETGELYFAVGNEIRIVDAEGNVSTLLSLPEGEKISGIQKDIGNEGKFVFTAFTNEKGIIYLYEDSNLIKVNEVIGSEYQNHPSVSSITYLEDNDDKVVIFSGDDGTYEYRLEAQVTQPEIASTYPTENAEVTYGCDSVSFTFTEAYPSETFDIDITQDGNTFDGEYSWNVSDDGKKVTVKFPSKLPLGSYQVSLGDEAFPDIYSLPFSINFPDLNTAEVSTASNASYPSFSFQFADTIPQLENPQLKIDGEPVNVDVASLIVNDDKIDLNNNSYQFTNGQHLIQIIEDGNTVFEFTYSSTVGIDNLSTNQNSLPYPNPCSSGISLNVPLPSNAKISTILIVDMQGKIKKQEYIGQNNQNAQLDVDDLTTGKYVIHYLTEEGRQIKGAKFVKQ